MTKIDVVSGFLGAGKTTLIKKLLKEALDGSKTVLIENEFGEIGIDGGFLKESGIEIKEMNSGCICCSLVGDFGTSLKEVIHTYAPERILIEPSGVGKLSDVLKAVEDVAGSLDVQINSAVAVVDASKCKMYLKNFGEFFINQIAYAGTIILSRTDKLSPEKISACVEMIRQHNEKATIITTPLAQLDGKTVLETIEGKDKLEGLMQEMMEKAEEEHEHHHHEHHHHDGECCHHDHDHEEHEHHHDHDHHHHHADEVFTSWGMETPNVYSAEEIEKILTALDSGEYGTILRAKGMVAAEDGSWIYYDYVPEEHEVRSGNPQVTGKICVIGSKLEEEKLAVLFGK
ncbi:MAG: GTP-binding protein [Lachnospiraceae bacterium]|nr:GTP-binding protein [Lachnospiraceae bacterium]